MALEDYGSIMQSGFNLVPDFNKQLLQRAQANELNAEAQQQQMQAQAIQQKQARAQQFQQAFAQSDGSPEAVSRLIMQYPEFADQLKSGWDVLDKENHEGALTSLGEVYSAANGGMWDLASKQAHAMIDSYKAGGHSDPAYDQIGDLIDKAAAGDTKAQDTAKTMLGSMIAAKTGPEHFASVYGSLNPSDKGFTLDAGATRYDGNGNIVAQSPYLKGADGSVYERNGSAPSSEGGDTSAGATVKRTHGYTPRARDGGDNPDNVVDNKIAALSKAVGVDPDTPMNPQQFAAFVRALPGTENAKGNNVGGIKDGAYARSQPGYAGHVGQYATFTTPEAGQAAMERLLTARFYDRGQQSIRDIIEGKPVGGSQAASVAPSSAPAGYHLLTPGKDSPNDYHVLSAAEVKAHGLDPSQQYQLNTRTGQITGLGKRDGADDDVLSQYGIAPAETGLTVLNKLPANMASQVKALAEGRLPMPSSFALAKPYWQKMLQLTAQYDPSFDAANAPARKAAIQAFTGMGKGAQVVSSVNRVANHLNTLWNESQKLAGPELGNSTLNSLVAGAGQAFEPADAKAYDTAVGFVAGELEKIARNSPGTEAGVERVVKNLGRKNSSATRESAIKTAVDIIAGAIDPLKEQYNSAFTNGATRPNIPWVTPQAQKVYSRIGGTSGGVDLSLTGSGADTNSSNDAAPHSGGVVRVQTAAQWQALAPGTHYIDPNGVHRVKK